MTTTLADILAQGGGQLPEGWDARAYALLVPDPTYEAAMAAQDAYRPDGWPHYLQPVELNGEIHWGIGADVLTEALPPYGILQHVFSHLPAEMAATVLIVPWDEFLAMLPSQSTPEAP